jgi:hypothetical protein
VHWGLRHFSGVSLSGWDSTARNDQIEDVRSDAANRSFVFTYSFIEPGDRIPHLTQIDFKIGVTKHYNFTYQANQSLQSPFSPPADFGTTHLLSTLTDQELNVTTPSLTERTTPAS